MEDFKGSLEKLKENAVLHWTEDLLDAAKNISVLEKLIDTQDDFIALLKVASRTPLSWQKVLAESQTLSYQLFLKHLMLLSDLGGEALNKLTPLHNYFKNDSITFDWEGKEFTYNFKAIHEKCNLTNSALKVDAKAMSKPAVFTDRMMDVIMLLLFGSLDKKNFLPADVVTKCNVGNLLGKSEELDLFIKANYIRVSKQIAGEKANALGHFAQSYVAKKLKTSLPNGWQVKMESNLTNVTHTDESGKVTNFDLVAISPNNSEFGIEVSFQVTTNSTIERKARESLSLAEKAHDAGHKLCYVIDGAGNINVRSSAINTICENSDCTVSMSDHDLIKLVRFLIKSDS